MPRFIFIPLLLFSLKGLTQNTKADSLLKLLPGANDTTKANILNQLSSSYWYSDPQKTIQYADQAIDIAKHLGFKRALASAYNNKGAGLYQQNQYDEAIKWYTEAMNVHKQAGNYKGEAYVLSNIGMIYWKQTKLDTAVQYYLKAMKIWEDHNDEREKASVLQNIGNVYSDQEDYEHALSYYFKALEIERKYNAPHREISMTLSNIGTAYLSQNKHDEALQYFLESLPYLSENDIESRAISISNIGITYTEMRKFEEALPYLTEALKLQEETGDKEAMVHTVLGLAQVYLHQNNYAQAEETAKRALGISKEVGEKNREAEAWQMLSTISEKKGDFKNAFNYYTNYITVRDSIRSRENIYKVAHLEASYESGKKLELLKKENEQREFRRNAIGAGLIALLIIAALIVSRQRLKIKQGKELVLINAQLKKQSQQLEKQTIKLQELDKAKSNFFANISHEFRTPLTLVLNGLVDKISKARTENNNSELEQLEVMHRNAKRLLNLINQLLDLSKLDAHEMKLALDNCDLSEMTDIIYASFSTYSQSKNINFELSRPAGKILCRVDADKLEKIIYNLLSNAFKFTPAGGTVKLSVSAEDDKVRISVADSGRGIEQQQLEKIFDRFYQGDQYYADEQGTGIGLALTKELVELHKGKIWAESRPGMGADFILEIPFIPVTGQGEYNYVKQDNWIPGAIPVNAAAGSSSPTDEKPIVLIVEDNHDLRQYIKQHLEEKYQVIESENGKLGLEKAIACIPDLIISDWMMPEMDGLSLCKSIKADERTSHIPVVLLTALAADDAKLKGLETGADDYLTKPFDNRELHARVKNLIDTRRQLREKFGKELHLGPKKVKVASMDEKFLERVMATIEAHMGDPAFSMEKFGQEVGLSRMQLHRKLKALTNESPGDFLRSMRLQKAKRLLESRAGNVSEIAYEVGFNNLSYFSKCYKEQFGLSPNETSAMLQ